MNIMMMKNVIAKRYNRIRATVQSLWLLIREPFVAIAVINEVGLREYLTGGNDLEDVDLSNAYTSHD